MNPKTVRCNNRASRPVVRVVDPGDFKLTPALKAAMALTPEAEFQRLRHAVRKLDVQVADLRLRQDKGQRVNARLGVISQQRTDAMHALVTLSGLMNRRAVEA